MADKGFNIQDLLALHDTVLTAPPMMCKNNYLHEHQLPQDKLQPQGFILNA